MKPFILLFFTLTVALSAKDISEIAYFTLDPNQIHTVHCHERNTGVTTVVFPSEISGIYAARVDVKFNEKKPNPFLLSFTPGKPYFTIKSLSSNEAQGAINVVYNKQVYVLHLKTSKKAHSSVSFVPPKLPKLTDAKASKAKSPSVALLLSMLDKAKAYHLIKEHYPAQLTDVSYDAPKTVMNYATHEILLNEVIRFESRDTVFFHLEIKNKTLRELRYNPKDFAVNVGDKIFYATLTDASGVVPSQGQTKAWFCINRTKSGGRNNLAVKNDWKILLNVSQLPEIKQLVKPKIEEKTVDSRLEKKTEIKVLPDVKLEEVTK